MRTPIPRNISRSRPVDVHAQAWPFTGVSRESVDADCLWNALYNFAHDPLHRSIRFHMNQAGTLNPFLPHFLWTERGPDGARTVNDAWPLGAIDSAHVPPPDPVTGERFKPLPQSPARSKAHGAARWVDKHLGTKIDTALDYPRLVTRRGMPDSSYAAFTVDATAPVGVERMYRNLYRRRGGIARGGGIAAGSMAALSLLPVLTRAIAGIDRSEGGREFGHVAGTIGGALAGIRLAMLSHNTRQTANFAHGLHTGAIPTPDIYRSGVEGANFAKSLARWERFHKSLSGTRAGRAYLGKGGVAAPALAMLATILAGRAAGHSLGSGVDAFVPAVTSKERRRITAK